MIHTTAKMPHVTMESTRQIAQCRLGGGGYGETVGAAYAAGAPAGTCGAAGTGMLPITWETGTQSVKPSLRQRSVNKMFPDATYFCISANVYGPYSFKSRLMK